MNSWFKYAVNRDSSLPPQWLCMPLLDGYDNKADNHFNVVVCWIISLLPCLVALGLIFGFK